MLTEKKYYSFLCYIFGIIVIFSVNQVFAYCVGGVEIPLSPNPYPCTTQPWCPVDQAYLKAINVEQVELPNGNIGFKINNLETTFCQGGGLSFPAQWIVSLLAYPNSCPDISKSFPRGNQYDTGRLVNSGTSSLNDFLIDDNQGVNNGWPKGDYCVTVGEEFKGVDGNSSYWTARYIGKPTPILSQKSYNCNRNTYQCEVVNDTSGQYPTESGCKSDCVATSAKCGDGNVDSGEDCDDGNTNNGDGCSSVCKKEVLVRCGDNIINQPSEQCDGSAIGSCKNGCENNCNCKPQSSYDPVCGNGKVDPGEECDGGSCASGAPCVSCKCEIVPCTYTNSEKSGYRCGQSQLTEYACVDPIEKDENILSQRNAPKCLSNGILDVGESCEPSSGGCTANCKIDPLSELSYDNSSNKAVTGLATYENATNIRFNKLQPRPYCPAEESYYVPYSCPPCTTTTSGDPPVSTTTCSTCYELRWRCNGYPKYTSITNNGGECGQNVACSKFYDIGSHQINHSFTEKPGTYYLTHLPQLAMNQRTGYEVSCSGWNTAGYYDSCTYTQRLNFCVAPKSSSSFSGAKYTWVAENPDGEKVNPSGGTYNFAEWLYKDIVKLNKNYSVVYKVDTQVYYVDHVYNSSCTYQRKMDTPPSISGPSYVAPRFYRCPVPQLLEITPINPNPLVMKGSQDGSDANKDLNSTQELSLLVKCTDNTQLEEIKTNPGGSGNNSVDWDYGQLGSCSPGINIDNSLLLTTGDNVSDCEGRIKANLGRKIDSTNILYYFYNNFNWGPLWGAKGVTIKGGDRVSEEFRYTGDVIQNPPPGFEKLLSPTGE